MNGAPVLDRTGGQLRGHRLGIPRDALVGRGRERVRLTELLSSNRVVTIAGERGIGKTRLALDVAASLDRPDGIWLVEMGRATEPALVAGTVASALGVSDAPGRSTTRSLTLAIGDRDLAIVLDGCDDNAAATVALVEALVSACPGATFILTAPEPVGIANGAVLDLRPMSLPRPGNVDPNAILRCGSVALFLARASTANSGFVLNASNASDVAALCRTLGGNPLAIELAAARSDILTPDEISALIQRQVTETGGLLSPVVATISWTCSLLSAGERALLRRLSLFSGGCTLSSAESVCSGAGLGADDVFEALARLVGSSLLRADTSGTEARYRLDSSVHAFAADRLAEAGEVHDTAERHSWWYAGLAEHAEPQLTGANQRAWLGRLDDEVGNLRRALKFSVRSHQSALAMRLAGALATYWTARGSVVEGRIWFARVLALSNGALPPLRAKALWGASLVTLALGDAGTAMRFTQESLAIGRALEDDWATGRALMALGACVRRDDDTSALPMLEEGIGRSTEARDGWCVAQEFALAGLANLDANRLAEARQALDQAVGVSRQIGDLRTIAFGLVTLGTLARRSNDNWSAETLWEEALRVAIAGDLLEEAAAAQVGLGTIAAEGGDDDIAEKRILDGLALARVAGSAWNEVEARYRLGRLSLGRGDVERAQHELEAARARADSAALPAGVVSAGLAQVVAARDDWPLAEHLAKEALRVARAGGQRSDVATAMLVRANAARRREGAEPSLPMFREVLGAFEHLDELPGLLAALEGVGGVAAVGGMPFHAARVLGAAAAVRESHRLVRFGPDCPFYDSDVAALRERLTDDDLEGTWCEGTAMSLADAVSLARHGPPEPKGMDAGWERLTKAERGVVALVAEGLTNRQIGERLLISRHTVQTHLAHVFAKLGINSRTVLAREATTRQRARRRGMARPVGLR